MSLIKTTLNFSSLWEMIFTCMHMYLFMFFTHIYINMCIGMCGVKEFGHLGPLYTKLKAHAEEEEKPEDERKKSK